MLIGRKRVSKQDCVIWNGSVKDIRRLVREREKKRLTTERITRDEILGSRKRKEGENNPMKRGERVRRNR